MSIKNAVSKTIAYAKRNGTRAAFNAALERIYVINRDDYRFVPLSAAVIEEQKKEYRLLAEAGNIVRFSIVVPLFETPEKYLRETIESVIAQTYGNWELVLADASGQPLQAAIEYTRDDPRIRYCHLDKNEGISENTNKGIEMACGDYIGLLDHDDILTPDALYEMARVIRKSMKESRLSRYTGCPIRLIYSDEDKFDDALGRYFEYHEKPSFNMDYLMSNNYICHFTMLRSDIIKRLKLRGEFDGAQDYDLFLRSCAEAALENPQGSLDIAHINKVLYHWRCHSASTAANPASKTYAYEAGRRALQSLMNSSGIRAEATHLPHLGFYRLEYVPDIFSQRSDIGCIGGMIMSKRHKLCGGMYRKDKGLAFEDLPEGYSGGYQHRATVQQDALAVDVRFMILRPELVPLYEEVTGCKYEKTAKLWPKDGKRGVTNTAASQFDRMKPEKIAELSCRLGEEIRKRGYRIMWDPQIVLQL